MVRDRLSEFHTHSLEPSTVVEIEPTRVVYDTSSRLDQFRIHVDELRQSLDQLDNRIRNLQNRQTAVLAQSVVQPEEKAHLEALIQEIKDHVKSLKPRVRAIEADLKRDEANGSNQFRTSAEFRIRRDQCEMIKKKLNDLLQMFNHTQVEYKQRVSRRVKRQLEMAGEHLSTEEVDQMLDSNSSDIFYRQLNPLNFAVKLALEDATNRHNEILNLEQSIRELNEIFQDVFDMVRSQGELVDNIEKNITSATEYTSEARQNVKQAVVYKKSALRKKIICIILAIIVPEIL
uniref:t-SNARE coiled-coil homology domain-containing protein n=1 Tax=Acrobeloides nanus TaxID=290746 RepID=A0A914BUS4_9BILA